MREFLINSENLLNREAVQYLKTKRAEGLLPCKWVRFNEKIKIAYFEEGYTPLSTALSKLTLEQICDIGNSLLKLIVHLENSEVLTPENLTLDEDSIYLTAEGAAQFIYMPVNLPDESFSSQIYVKRVYALLEELCKAVPEGADLWRRIEYEKANNLGNWTSVFAILDDPYSETNNLIYLKGINTPGDVVFQVGQEEFLIGSDKNQVDGFIDAESVVNPLHARIIWDETGFYVMDMDTAGGTFVNDSRIDPMTKVKIGFGTVLRFAEYTFSVE